MTAKVFIGGSWDFAVYGTSTLTWTDSGGTFSTSLSTGNYEHSSSGNKGICDRAGAASPSFPTQFGAALTAAMDVASPTVAHTIVFADGVYTFSVNTGTLAFTFSTAPQLLMRKLLGFAAASAGPAASFASTIFPWFWIKPRYAGLVNYMFPTRDEATKERVSASGKTKRQKPTSVVRLAHWEHQFEPKYMIDRDAYGATGETITHLYTWEDLWTDFGLAERPIGLYVEQAGGNFEKLAFSLVQADYSKAVVKRRAPSDDARFMVSIDARLWRASATNTFARTFNT